MDHPPDRTTSARVIAAWQVTYSDPLTLRAGEEVTVGKHDTEWPGWVWCTNRAGKGGWVPEQYIEEHGSEGAARYDYTAVELAVNVGDELLVGQRINGWVWCTNANGQSGWVPERNLEMISTQPE